MATVEVKHVVSVQLNLSEEEAKYLHGLTQNYLGGNPDSEPPEEYEMRYNLFNALTTAMK